MIVEVPGDKSVTQRALILASIAEGKSRLSGLLAGADPRSTAAALRSLGAEIPDLPPDGSAIVVRGRGLRALQEPTRDLDLENSGTGARLLLGVLCPQSFDSTLVGDASLSSRPMGRVTEPLEAMGARFEALGEPDRLPVRVLGRTLQSVDLDLPVASAQVKSALLLAGVVGGASVLLTQPGRCRDHTERMLSSFGVSLVTRAVAGGWRVELSEPPERLAGRPIVVPRDFSSAAFFIVLAALGGAGSELTLAEVGINDTRTGLLNVLRRMGADVEVTEEAKETGSGEPRGSITVRPSSLKGTDIGGGEIPVSLDELPLLAIAAARADGVTRITDAGELRVKETDRIRALALNLRAVGVVVEELEDGLEIQGGEGPLVGRVESFDDHRIAMAFGILGALSENEIEVGNPEVVEVSYPTFWRDLRYVIGKSSGPTLSHMAAREPQVEAVTSAAPTARRAVVVLDGPAGSGKSTTARAVARRLGYRHLDSGALYRAMTWALLEEGRDPSTWSTLSLQELGDQGIEVRLSPTGVIVQLHGKTLTDELRGEEVTHHVSELAGLAQVRTWLLGIQQQAGREGGLVADGRDMGTVVFPEANVKVYLTAELGERARRRLRERGVDAPGSGAAALESVRIEARDERDSQREHSPLKRAPEAVVIDTTHLDFAEQVDAVVELVREWERGAGKS